MRNVSLFIPGGQIRLPVNGLLKNDAALSFAAMVSGAVQRPVPITSSPSVPPVVFDATLKFETLVPGQPTGIANTKPSTLNSKP